MTVYSHTDRQRSPAGNRRLAKKRVQYLNEALRFVSSLVLADSLVLRKSASSPSAKTLPTMQKKDIIFDRQFLGRQLCDNSIYNGRQNKSNS